MITSLYAKLSSLEINKQICGQTSLAEGFASSSAATSARLFIFFIALLTVRPRPFFYCYGAAQRAVRQLFDPYNNPFSQQYIYTRREKKNWTLYRITLISVWRPLRASPGENEMKKRLVIRSPSVRGANYIIDAWDFGPCNIVSIDLATALLKNGDRA